MPYVTDIERTEPVTTCTRQASERAEKGSRRRGLQRRLRGLDRGPDGSSAGRPAGESNPIAWSKPEARHRSRACFQMCCAYRLRSSSGSKADARLSRLARTCAPETHTDHLLELARAVIMVPVSFSGSKNLRTEKHLSTPHCAVLLHMGNSAHLVIL